MREAATAERWDHSLHAQIKSKMHELIGCMCVVTFKPEGERRGMIERIGALGEEERFRVVTND